jgi:4-amino-4-deoxy-L-arabinose transferase-like glycosyltransferase
VTAGRTPIWATPPGAAIIVLLLMLPRALFAARFGLIGDEAYYAIWSFHPGFGYFDHSPAVAWLIWLGRAVFGESEFAVRSMFLVADLVVCAALYRLGILLSGDRRIAAVAPVAYSVTVGVLITFSVATPDGPSTMFWVLAIWAVAEFQRGRNANWWLLAGAFAGFGLLSKYTVVFLGAGLLFYLLTSRERIAWLKLWQVWAGGALALLLFAPVIWINAQRDWNSFRFQLGRSNFSGGALHLDEFLRFLIEEGIQLLPTLYVFVILGIALFFLRRAKSLALPVLTATPMAAYFLADALFGRVNPNWTAPLFPILALVGAWAAVTVRPRTWLRWPLDVLYVLHIPLGLGLMLFAFEAVDTRSIPFVGPVRAFDFVYGWPDLWSKVSATAKANGAQWVDAPDYSLTGWLGYYGRIARDPLPVFETNAPFRYAYMPPMDPGLAAAPHLLINPATPPADALDLGTITRDYAGAPLATYRVYLVK